MNSTTSHEMRNPLNSICSNIDNQEQHISDLENLLGEIALKEDVQAKVNGVF